MTQCTNPQSPNESLNHQLAKSSMVADSHFIPDSNLTVVEHFPEHPAAPRFREAGLQARGG
jgi:hypothetical protein